MFLSGIKYNNKTGRLFPKGFLLTEPVTILYIKFLKNVIFISKLKNQVQKYYLFSLFLFLP